MVNNKKSKDKTVKDAKFEFPGLIGNIKADCKKLKRYFSKKKRSFLIVLVFIVLAGLIINYVTPEIVKDGSYRGRNIEDGSAGNNVSPFESITINPEIEFDEYEKATDRDTNYWQTWNWETSLIYAHIREIDKLNTEMKVVINPPPSESFSKKEILVNVKCRESNTSAIKDVTPAAEVAQILDRSFNIFDKAEIGDTLITYCLDKECINIGGQCILVVRE